MSTDTSTKTRNGVSRNEVSKSNRCFVVLPYDKHGTDFYETYARPACERAGFSAERADQQLCHDIAEGIVTSLGIAPMVIAYLGSPPWNENVILELGYRLATRLPMVIMCDEQPDHSNFTLPFQLTTMRVEKVPACEDVEETLRDEIVARTAEIMRAEARRSTTLACNQAIAVIHAPAGAFSGREAVYANASSRAMQLFGADGQLVGRTLEQFVEDRKNDMPDYQFKTFCWEQQRLAQNPSPDTSVIATTPIVFATGKFQGRAYLPIIVNHENVGDIQRITVLYLDVTSVVKRVTHNVLDMDYYISKLNPNSKPIADLLKSNSAPARPNYADGVFLAHNTADKARVRPIFDLLLQGDGDPWFDEVCIQPGENWMSAIEEGLAKCRAAFVFVGRNGYGAFQDEAELRHLLRRALRERRMPLVPILMDGIEEPPGLLELYQGVRYEEAVTEKWIQNFIKNELPPREEKSDRLPRRPR